MLAVGVKKEFRLAGSLPCLRRLNVTKMGWTGFARHDPAAPSHASC